MPANDHSAVLLDASAMGVLLRHSLPDSRSVHECRIHQTRRRISRKTEEQGAPYLGVVYELKSADAAPTPVAHWCYVKAFSRGASRTAHEAQAALRIEALDALAWWLPQDPAMPHLAEFLDPQRVQGELRHLLGAADDAAPPPAVAIVRHEPESHCTARFELNLQDGRRAVYGKTYSDDAWIDAARRVDALWSASQNDGAFAIARPRGASAELHAVWQDEARGRPLRAALHAAGAQVWLVRVARALATLQSGPDVGDAPLSPSALLGRTIKQCDKLIRADASLANQIGPALELLRRSVPDNAVTVAAHGDFHVDQMLCADERVVLFDFDNFVRGSAALDVADFASQLLTDTDFEVQRRTQLAARFIDHCMARFPHPPQWFELDWHLRALLLRKAYSFFVRHRAGWRERAGEAATLAARGVTQLIPDCLGSLS